MDELVDLVAEEFDCTNEVAREVVTEILMENYGEFNVAQVEEKVLTKKAFNELAASIAMELNCTIAEAATALFFSNNDAQEASRAIMEQMTAAQGEAGKIFTPVCHMLNIVK